MPPNDVTRRLIFSLLNIFSTNFLIRKKKIWKILRPQLIKYSQMQSIICFHANSPLHLIFSLFRKSVNATHHRIEEDVPSCYYQNDHYRFLACFDRILSKPTKASILFKTSFSPGKRQIQESNKIQIFTPVSWIRVLSIRVYQSSSGISWDPWTSTLTLEELRSDA